MKKKIVKGSRKIVWVLGAGASRGAGSYTTVQRNGRISIPTQDSFWETILRFADAPDRKDIEAFLFRYFNGYKRVPAKIPANKRRKLLDKVDVEEVFTFLSERVSTTTISSSLKQYFRDRIWSALIRSIASTFTRFDANNQTRLVYKNFYENHFKKWDSIISFNYDTILENSLPHATSWYHFGGNTNGIPIFKPHGSVDWSEKSGQDIIYRCSEESPLIVAPSHLKFIGFESANGNNNNGYLNNSPVIGKVWSEMEARMKSAKALVFIGYSFPEADLYFSSVLRTVLTNSTRQIRIVLVNPDAQRIAERLSERFSIDKGHIQSHFDFNVFCKLNRKDILE